MELRTDIDIQPIKPSPIKEAVVEIRFDGSLDKIDELFFSIYSSVKDLFNGVNYSRLPVLDVPLQVRKTNKNFELAPHYQLDGESYVLRVAPCAISIGIIGEYTNWDNFYKFIANVIDKYIPLNINRVGLRYVSFFKINIFEKTNINLTIGNNRVITDKNLIRHEFESHPFYCVLQISNIATLAVSPQIQGSNVDIDVICNNTSNGIDASNIKDIIVKAHTTMKNILGTILAEDFIKELQQNDSNS